MGSDLYSILKIDAAASQDEVKRAYRAIARKYHPDKNPGDKQAEQIFKEAAEAYRVLGDKDLRARYDRGQSVELGIADHQESPADIFQEIFGTRARRGSGAGRKAERGDDLRYTLEIDFEDAAKGTDRQISVPGSKKCGGCGGTGARAGTSPALCRTCAGRGEVRVEQGFFSLPRSCPDCGGTGKRIGESCADCGGKGELKSTRTLSVSIPSGIETGTRLKLRGEGERGRGGGPAGDLFVVVEVKPHPFFRRQGADVLLELPLRFTDAALGATLEVPTLDGMVRLEVPPGTQSGREFRLKAKGIPVRGRPRGDQLVRVQVEVPTPLSPAQRRLVESLRELADGRSPRVEEFEELVARYKR